MSTQRHIIKNQVLELGLPSPSTAQQIQDAVSRIYHQKIIPIIDSCCSEAGNSADVHRFDSLCIDVGSIPIDDLEKELPARTESRLKNLLKKYINYLESKDTPIGVLPDSIVVVPAHVSRGELLNYFIDNGTLPWWADEIDTKGLEENLKRWISTSPDEAADFVTRIASDTAKLKRLVYQFSDRVLLSAAKGVLRRSNPDIRRFLPVFVKAFLPADFQGKHSRKEIRLALWYEIFSIIVNAPPVGVDFLFFCDELLMRLSQRLDVSYRVLEGVITKAAGKNGRNGLQLKRALSPLMSEGIFRGKVKENILQESPASAQSHEEVLFSTKTEIRADGQGKENSKLSCLQTRIKENMHNRHNGRENRLKDITDSLPKSTETLIKPIEARESSTRPAEQPGRQSETISTINQLPDSSEHVSEGPIAKHSSLIDGLLREMENTTKGSSHKEISSESQTRFNKLIKSLRALQRGMVSTEEANLLRHLKVLVNELLWESNISNSRRYKVGDTYKEASPEVPGRIIDKTPEGNVSPDKLASFTSIENLYRQLQITIAALKQDIQYSHRGQLHAKVSQKTGTETRDKLLSNGKGKPEHKKNYNKVFKLLEQFLALPYFEKEAVSRLAAVIKTLTSSELFQHEEQLQQLQHELKAVLQITRDTIKVRKAKKVRKQESEATISDDTTITYHPMSKTLTRNVRPLKGNLRNTDLSNIVHKVKLTKDGKDELNTTSRPRAKDNDTFAGIDSHQIESLKNIRGDEGNKAATIEKRKYPSKHQLDLLKEPLVMSQTTNVTAHKAINPASIKMWSLERDTLKSNKENVPKEGVNDKARYGDNNNKQGANGLYIDTGRNESIDESKETYIQNAGLVILWPFLNKFFVSTNLVRKGLFISPEASERAVHLLQYLVDGSLETPEYMLSLNKVLCGRKLAKPVARDFEITERESLEAVAFLQSVIQNWPALGNISIAGFRIAFLQRRGLLVPRNGDWLVQVERQTHDILLDRLNWTISVIRLPWLDNIIYTEW